MSRIPEYGTPCEDSPEASERDFAYARRRDGSLVDPSRYARYRLHELEEQLEALPTEDSATRDSILDGLREVEGVLANGNGEMPKEAAE